MEQSMSPTASAGASPRLRSQGKARVTRRALSAAAVVPSAHPYTWTTCRARRRPQCATAYCRRCRSSALS
eukprot:11216041-Lingulodinium_polyedra.AAC.1